MGKAKVACVQMGPVYMDPQRTLTKTFDYIEKAGKLHADIVLFPELVLSGCYYGLSCKPDITEKVAEAIPGGTTDKVGDKAREYGMYVIVGLAERGPLSTYFDSAVLINREGKVQGIHRKTHVHPPTEHIFKAGSQYSVYQTDFAKIGMLICYDLCFPETARIMALKGAEMIFHPAAIWKNQGLTIENLYEQSFKSRALDNRVFLVTVNQVGEDPDLNDYFIGHSMIVSPLGDTLALAGAEETMITADIDFEEWAERKRAVTWNPFRQRVPSHYSIISQE